MEWLDMAKLWGPAVPFILIVLKAHHDLIYKILPEGLKAIRSEMREVEARAVLRHDEHMEVMDKIACAIEGRLDKPAAKKKGPDESSSLHGPNGKPSAPRPHDATAGLSLR